jgi:hypothetical protein
MITGTRRNICFHGIGKPQRELEPDEGGYWTSVDEYKRILDEISAWPDVRITFDDGNVTDGRGEVPRALQLGEPADVLPRAREDRRPLALECRRVAVRGPGQRAHGRSVVPAPIEDP